MRIPIDHRTISLMIEKEMDKRYYNVVCEQIPVCDLKHGTLVAGYKIYFSVDQNVAHSRLLMLEFTKHTIVCYRYMPDGRRKQIIAYNFELMIRQQQNRAKALENLAGTFRVDVEAKLQSGEI